MEILVVLAVLLNPILAALIDYVRETRRSASAQDDWQLLVDTMRAEYERQLSNARNCPEQLRIANGVIERLMQLQAPGLGGVNISGSQVAVGRDLTGGSASRRDDS